MGTADRKFSLRNSRGTPPVAVVLAASALWTAGCKLPTVNVGTPEPIKLDVNMRVDVYQHSDAEPDASEQQREYDAVIKQQRDRMAQVQTLKNSRWVGENHRGLLSVRELPAGNDGKWVKSTVEAENADRLYLMRAEAKKRNLLLTDIEKEQWQARVKASFQGEWVEVSDGPDGKYRWVKKKSNTVVE